MSSIAELSQFVYDHVRARGYCDGELLHEVRQQLIKCIEELGEFSIALGYGDNEVNELADVAIPLLVLAALVGADGELAAPGYRIHADMSPTEYILFGLAKLARHIFDDALPEPKAVVSAIQRVCYVADVCGIDLDIAVREKVTRAL